MPAHLREIPFEGIEIDEEGGGWDLVAQHGTGMGSGLLKNLPRAPSLTSKKFSVVSPRVTQERVMCNILASSTLGGLLVAGFSATDRQGGHA
jgi:hypothetical protein